MESDLLRLDLTVLDVHLVATQHDGDVLTDTAQITVPCGDILVSQARGDVEHDDGALPMDVIAVAQTTELLLTRSIPAVEPDLAPVGGEVQRADLDSDRGLVLLLELASQMALDECGLARAAISD